MTTASASDDVLLEIDLPHAPDTVWRAITETDLVGEWLGVAVSATLLILLWTPKASRFFDPSVTS